MNFQEGNTDFPKRWLPVLLDSWRRILASTADANLEGRLRVFTNAAAEFAGLVARGANKADVADALEGLRRPYLADADDDAVQAILSNAFNQAEEAAEYRIPDDVMSSIMADVAIVSGRDDFEEKGRRLDEAKRRREGGGPNISATPFVWRDPKLIRPRDFLYGHHFIRRYLSGTVAMGGVGKSSELGVELAAMITARNLLGIKPKRPLRVWYINLEDPRDEIDRRLAAVFQHYGITPMDIGDRLFVDSGRERKIVIARETKGGLVIAEPVVADIIEAVQTNKIDVIMVDPFVGCYEINENDNSKINATCQEWAKIAEQGCAIDLAHHVRKGGSSSGHTIEDARGATALINSCRSVRVLNTMTKEEGDQACVERHRSYFRIDNGKANLAPPPECSEWRKYVSVNLDNATEESEADEVGVVTAWQWPDPMESLTTYHLRMAQKAVSEGGPWRKDSQAKNWVGIPIAVALGLGPKDKAHAAKIKGVLKVWLSTGMFKEVEGKDEKSNPRTFIEVGKWAND
jgi:hypothetical protein